MAGMLDTLTVDPDRMREAAAEGFTTATAVADALVRRGVPFRAAHHIVGSLVAQAEEPGSGSTRSTDDASPPRSAGAATRRAALADEPGIGDVLRAAASIDGALASCDVIGGTAPGRVAAALAPPVPGSTGGGDRARRHARLRRPTADRGARVPEAGLATIDLVDHDPIGARSTTPGARPGPPTGRRRSVTTGRE